MNREISFSTTATIHSPKASIWRVLLSGQLYKAAWGAELKTTWEPGTDIQFNGVWENVEYSDKGVVVFRNENSLIKYSYWSSFWNVPDTPDEYCFISYSINPLDDFSCDLTITQEGFRDEKHYSDTLELWKNTMDIIKAESEKVGLAIISNNVFHNLNSIVDSIPEASYNKPVANGWNIAQVVEHIIIGNSDLKQFLTEATSNSPTPYDLHISSIRAMMLNKEDKLKSLDFLIPPVKKYDKQQHRELLSKIQTEIHDCIHTLDLSKKCSALEMPPFGYMSIFEWLNFCVFHILRHIWQIESIRKLD